jgi:hypothetical protein
MKCARLALMGADGSGKTWSMSPRRAWSCLGRAGWLYAVALAAGAAGCGTETATSSSAAADESESSRIVSGSLCPTCLPSVGGESSDFEGDLPLCAGFVRRRFVTDAQAEAAGYEIAGVRARVAREFEAPLRWREEAPRAFELAPAAAMPPSGFTPETSIRGVVSAASEVAFAELDPAFCDAAGVCPIGGEEPVRCADYVASIAPTLDLTLTLETDDDAIRAATLTSRLRLTGGEAEGSLVEFDGDLALARGTLRIGSGISDPHWGRLRAMLAFWPTTVRGMLTPELYPGELGIHDSNGQVVEYPSSPRSRYAPLSAHWPGDACAPGRLPIDADNLEGRATLERFSAEYSAIQAGVRDTPLLDADWDDVPGPGAGRAQIGLDLPGDPRPSCVDSGGNPSVDVDVHIWSADGRLDWTQTVPAQLERPSDEAVWLRLEHGDYFPADAEFWISSLKGIDLLGGAGARVRLEAALDEFGVSYGELRVMGVPECSREFRCLSSNASEAPSCAACDDTMTLLTVDWRR